jgi:hypothetical protein
MRRAGFAAALAFAGALPACGDAAGPVAEDSYVLRSIAGDALPALFSESEAVRVRIVADTLVLEDDLTGHEAQRLETYTKVDGSLDIYDTTISLRWVMREGRLEITYDCPDFATCIEPPHLAGTATATGLDFDYSLGRSPLIFERVGG